MGRARDSNARRGRTSSIEGERPEFAFEVGLHVQQFETEHLCVRDERIGSPVTDVDPLVDQRELAGDCRTVASAQAPAQGPMGPQRPGPSPPIAH
jgi:hypothetical protein